MDKEIMSVKKIWKVLEDGSKELYNIEFMNYEESLSIKKAAESLAADGKLKMNSLNVLEYNIERQLPKIGNLYYEIRLVEHEDSGCAIIAG